MRALIGLFVFGWLMKMNYDDLGRRRSGWVFLVAVAVLFAVGRQSNSPAALVLGLIVYCAAWVHTNIILTKLELAAAEAKLAEVPDQGSAR